MHTLVYNILYHFDEMAKFKAGLLLTFFWLARSFAS